MSTFSAALWTATITTERTNVAVAEGGTCVAVSVGIGGSVCEAVGAAVVGVMGGWVSVGGGVSVGSAVGTKNVDVGNGVNVGKSKSKRGVGVASVAGLGISFEAFGLGVSFEGPRDRNRLTGIEQRQHNKNSNKTGKRILPTCPC